MLVTLLFLLFIISVHVFCSKNEKSFFDRSNTVLTLIISIGFLSLGKFCPATLENIFK
jgi:hypothetical protein